MFLPSNITLKPGDSGDFVSELQRRLAQVGVFPEESVSGIYDGLTTSAVTQFQSQSGLATDGIAGPETLRRLNGALSGNVSGSGSSGSDSSGSQDGEENDKAAEDLQKSFYVADPQHQATEPDPFMQHQLSAQANEAAQQAQQTNQTPNLAPQTPGLTPAATEFLSAEAAQHQAPATTTPEPLSAADRTEQAIEQQAAMAANIDATNPAPAPTPTPPNLQDQLVNANIAEQASQQQAPAAAAPAVAEAAQTPAPAAPAENPMQPTAGFGQKAPDAAPAAPPPQNTAAPSQAMLHQQDFAAQAAAQPTQPESMPQLETPAPSASPTQPQPTPPQEVAAEKPSLRERISGAVQKLVNYIESKLSPSTLQEVQAIGTALKQHGVQEKPIPRDAEISGPSQTPDVAAGQKQELG